MLGSSEDDDRVWGALELRINQTEQAWSLV